MKKKLFTFRVLGLLALMLMMGGGRVSADGWIDDLGKNPFSGHYGKKVVNALKLVDYDEEDLAPQDNHGNRITAVEGDMTSNILRFYVTQPCTLHITGMEAMLDKYGEPETISDTDYVRSQKIDISVERKSGVAIKKATVKWNMMLGELRLDRGQKKDVCINVPITSAGQYQIRVTSKVKNTKGICLHIVSVNNTASDVKAKKVTVKFDPNGGKVKNKTMSFTTGKQYGTLPKPTRNGYLFAGWYTAKKGGTLVNEKSSVKKAVTLYARWKKATYKIQYNCNGGKNTKANPTSYTISTKTFSLSNPTRKGYVFKGWYADSSFKKPIKKITKGSTGNKTIYAKWQVITYSIEFDGNGVNNGRMTRMSSLKYGQCYKLKKNSFKAPTGKQFKGWNTNKNGKGTNYKDQQEIADLTLKNGAIIKLYAQWELTRYNIRYVMNGGSNNSKNIKDFNTAEKREIKNGTRVGYTFAGWYLNSKLTGKSVTNVNQLPAENVTLYAKWKPNAYIIRYDSNGGIGSLKDVECTYDRSCTVSICPFERANYKFVNWNTMADGTGTSYDAGQQVKNIATSGVVKLYAQWKMINRIDNIQFTGKNYILNSANADPYNYTNSDEVANKLMEIFRGNTGITTVDNRRVNVALGTSNVPDNDVFLYACGRANSGTSCWIYAHSVYYTLYGEAIGGGGGPYNKSYIVPGVQGIRNVNYEILDRAGVRKTVGAYIRTSTHSMILLGYNKTGIAILEGNADNNGLVRISNYSWRDFNSAIMKNGQKQIQFIIQPR